jgi:hypothetical protein
VSTLPHRTASGRCYRRAQPRSPRTDIPSGESGELAAEARASSHNVTPLVRGSPPPLSSRGSQPTTLSAGTEHLAARSHGRGCLACETGARPLLRRRSSTHNSERWSGAPHCRTRCGFWGGAGLPHGGVAGTARWLS